jgi:hypothetical protein
MVSSTHLLCQWSIGLNFSYDTCGGFMQACHCHVRHHHAFFFNSPQVQELQTDLSKQKEASAKMTSELTQERGHVAELEER